MAGEPQTPAPAGGVPLVGPDGSVYTVDPAEAAQAQAAGYRPASPEEVQQAQLQEQFGSAAGQAASFGLGAARGLTFGLSDKALAGAGAVSPETLKGYAEANPTASGAGKVAGMLAPVLLSGGAGAVAEGAEAASGAAEGAGLLRTLAQAAPGSLLSKAGGAAAEATSGALGGGALARVAAGAARGALEMPAYAVGDAITEDVLDNKPLTAEQLLAEAGRGALIGGLTGGALEGALGLAADKLPAAFGKASEAADGLQSKLEEMAEGGSTEKVTTFADDLGKLNSHLDEVLPKVSEIRDDLIAQKLTGANAAGEASQLALAKMNGFLGELEDEGGIVKRAKGILGGAQEKLAGATTDLERFQILDDAKGALQKEIPYDRNVGSAAAAERLKPVKGVAAELRGLLEDGQVWGPAAQVQRDFNAQFTSLAQDAKGFGSDFLRKSLGADEAEEAIRGKVVDLKDARSLARGVARGDAPTLEKLDRLKGFAQRARDFTEFADQQAQQLPTGRKMFGTGALVDKVLQSQDAASASFQPSMGMQAARFLLGRERADVLEHLGRSGEVLAKVAGTAARVSERVSLGLKQALEGRVAGGGTAAAAPSADTVRQQLVKLDARRTNPDAQTAHLARLTQAIQPHAPQLSGHMQAAQTTKEQYLAQHAPRDPVPPGSTFGRQQPYQPSKAELAQYGRIQRAVQNPLSLVEDLGADRVTPEAVDAVRNTSPELYKQMVGQLGQRMLELKAPLSPEQMTQVSIFAGQPADYLVQMLPRTQAVFASAGPAGQPPGQMGPPANVKGLSKLDGASRADTTFGGGKL